ncbi:MAG: ABC transporter permease [Bacteroidales bacterium]|nr:ABC transporter permease [Bacteroidales bacterium]
MRPASYIASRLFNLSNQYVSSTIIRIAILSVAIGLAVMIVSVAIVVGFKNQIRDKVIGFIAPIKIELLDNNASVEAKPFVFDSTLFNLITSIDGVNHVQGVIFKPALIKTNDQIQGIVIKGVGNDYDLSYFTNKVIEGKIPDFQDSTASDEVLISKNIADKLQVGTGDFLRFWFVSSDQQHTRGRKLLISGIYETGLLEFDRIYAFADVRHLQKLNNWNTDQFSTIEVITKDVTLNQVINDKLYNELPVELTSMTVRESYPQIFDWLDLQDVNVLIIIVLMVLVSGITMLGTLLIIILERTSMVGLLKALGATNGMIRNIFHVLSLSILLRGLIIGNIFGIGFCFFQSYFGMLKLPAESYYLTEVPIDITIYQVLFINSGTLLLWAIMLYIPVTVINKINPSRAIRYE